MTAPDIYNHNVSGLTSLSRMPLNNNATSSLKRSSVSFTSQLAKLSVRSSPSLSRSASTATELLGLTRKRTSSSLGAKTSQEPRSKVSRVETSVTSTKANATFQAKDQLSGEHSPHEYLISMLQRHNIQAKTRPSLSMPKEYFVRPTNQSTENYAVLSTAVRARDLDLLRTFLKDQPGSHSLYCCNKFGESILHMACRRGFTDVVEFLLTEGKTSVRIVDDYGRTPLHDACWTSTHNAEVMNLLIKEAPELLLITDTRGHAPLHYTQRVDYPTWIAYLQKHEAEIVNCIRNAKKHYNDTIVPQSDPANDEHVEREVVHLLNKMANTVALPNEVALLSKFSIG